MYACGCSNGWTYLAFKQALFRAVGTTTYCHHKNEGWNRLTIKQHFDDLQLNFNLANVANTLFTPYVNE